MCLDVGQLTFVFKDKLSRVNLVWIYNTLMSINFHYHYLTFQIWARLSLKFCLFRCYFFNFKPCKLRPNRISILFWVYRILFWFELFNIHNISNEPNFHQNFTYFFVISVTCFSVFKPSKLYPNRVSILLWLYNILNWF